MPLGYDPTTGQLIYNPFTGQLALDCNKASIIAATNNRIFRLVDGEVVNRYDVPNPPLFSYPFIDRKWQLTLTPDRRLWFLAYTGEPDYRYFTVLDSDFVRIPSDYIGGAPSSRSQVLADAAGGVYLVGLGSGGGGYRALVKESFTSQGLLWDWDRFSYTAASHALALDSYGNLYVGSDTQNYTGGIKPVSSVYSATGVTKWDSDAVTGACISLALDLDESHVYAGFKLNGSHNLAKFATATGNLVWAIRIQSDTASSVYDLVVDHEGYIYAAGQIVDDYSLWKLDPDDGSIVWRKRHPLGYSPIIQYALAIDSENCVYVGGNRNESSIWKFSPSGSLLWRNPYFPLLDTVRGLVLDE